MPGLFQHVPSRQTGRVYFHRMKRTLLLLSLAAVFSGARAQKVPADLIIRSVSVIDVERGRTAADQAVVVKDGRIIAVTPTGKLRHSAPVEVDGSGKFLMPGLWDNHMHFGGGDTLAHENRNLLPLMLAYGITGVRDCAADISHFVLPWRDSIAKGLIDGPHIFTSGPKLEGYKSVWKGDIEIGTKEELAKALDSLEGLRVDFVKITDNTLQPALYLESIRETRKRGLAISGHVPYAIPMKDIVDAGISSIEHITYLLKAGSSEEAGISKGVADGSLKGRALSEKINTTYDKASARKMFRYMASKGVAVTPTLSLGHILSYWDEHDRSHDDYLRYIGKGLQSTYAGRVNNILKHDAAAIAQRKASYERSSAVLADLVAANVTILAGTDAGYLNSYCYPGLALHEELALMVKYGMTPQQALKASVINGPKFLQQKGYGAVAPGMHADLLLLDANPLDDIHNTQKIRGLVSGGRWRDRAQLDELLAETARRTAAGI